MQQVYKLWQLWMELWSREAPWEHPGSAPQVAMGRALVSFYPHTSSSFVCPGRHLGILSPDGGEGPNPTA